MLIRRPLNGLQPRTMRDAGRDPWDCIEVAHRSHWLSRWWRPLSYLVCFGTLAFIGVLLAWRG